MTKPSNQWSESCKLNADTTWSPKWKQCSKTWRNRNKWWATSKTEPGTQATLSEESKWVWKSSRVDIGHSKTCQSVQSQVNSRLFKILLTSFISKSFLIDRLTIFTRTGPWWFNRLTWRKLSCSTCLSTNVPSAACSTTMKSWPTAKYKLN